MPALRSEKLMKLFEDEIDDVKFGGAILKKGYPTPFNIETGYRVRTSKYDLPDSAAGGVAQGDCRFFKSLIDTDEYPWFAVYGYPWRIPGTFDSHAVDDQGPDYEGNPGSSYNITTIFHM